MTKYNAGVAQKLNLLFEKFEEVLSPEESLQLKEFVEVGEPLLAVEFFLDYLVDKSHSIPEFCKSEIEELIVLFGPHYLRLKDTYDYLNRTANE